MSKRPLRIHIIDPQPIVREGMVRVISETFGHASVSGSGSFPMAHDRISAEPTDLVVSAFRVGQESVLTFLAGLHEVSHQPRSLIVSDLDEIQVGILCARAGASGFVSRSAPVSDILDAARLVIAGRSYFSDRLSRALMAQAQRKTGSLHGMHLTARELQVFSHLGDGLRVSDVAATLGISVKTVETHRENIKNKLGLQTASQVSIAAARWLDDTTPSI